MTVPADDLQPPWRRFDEAIQQVGAVSHLSDAPLLADALVHALDEIYRLLEAWKADTGLTNAAQNDHVRGDGDGETAAALALARGENTHQLVTFEEGFGLGTQPFGTSPLGGGWHFQHYEDWRRLRAEPERERARWYGVRVAGHQVLDTLSVAHRWLLLVIPPPP